MFGGHTLRVAARRLRPIAAGVAAGAAAGGLWATKSASAEPSSGTWAWPTAAVSTLASSVGGTKLRLASYNILSDSLCDAESFDCCDPADVDPDTRLARIKVKLAAEMEAGAVICLQEVSRHWAGELVPLFEKHGYNHMEVPHDSDRLSTGRDRLCTIMT